MKTEFPLRDAIWECCDCVYRRAGQDRSIAVFLRKCDTHGDTWHRPMLLNPEGGLTPIWAMEPNPGTASRLDSAPACQSPSDSFG